jgi:penicillin-binding protein 1A
MTLFKLILKWFAIFSLIALIGVATGAYTFYNYLINDLPDVSQLKEIKYQTPFRIYSKDNLLIAQFGEKKRKPISINKIPKQLIQAFLTAEDDRYYDHPGVDYKSIIRASIQLLLTGKKKQGGSTITMQVTRNFLLNREKTYSRKFKEIILSLQIEKTYSKDEILELYLNKIYTGHRSYGIVAAAEVYYGKTLNELTLAQQAMIAGLPKAPSAYNPITNPKRAIIRRNYILRRMQLLAYISPEEAESALKEPVSAKLYTPPIELSVPYVAEMVRREMLKRYGEEAYTNGMKIYTTIGSTLQIAATKALRYALHKYDKRYGYRALPHPVFTTEVAFKKLKIIGDTHPAHILSIDNKQVSVRLQNNTIIEVPWKNFLWARRFKTNNYPRGAKRPRSLKAAIKTNDIIRIRQINEEWELTQVPKVQGGFASLNPMNGAIHAIVGGYDFYQSEYNRAIQAKRQPGSGFKPVVYATALKEGLTLATVINDAPIVITKGSSKDRAWRPQNYSHRYYGPTRIRAALYKSRNIVSIRLMQTVGIEKVIETAKDFGFTDDQLPYGLSLALGSGSASPLRMANFYAIFANGGFLVEPHFIEHIENHKGEIIVKTPIKTACPLCVDVPAEVLDATQLLSTRAPRVLSPQITFLMNSVLRDVIRRGTATRAQVLKRNDLAGKTGTTNGQRDAWFNGFHPSIVASAWVGLDSYKTLGRGETGGKTALPMWIRFMETALKETPESPLIPPKGIVRKYIGSVSDVITASGPVGGSWEYFVEGVYPKRTLSLIIGNRYKSNSVSKKSKRVRKAARTKVIRRTVEDLF